MMIATIKDEMIETIVDTITEIGQILETEKGISRGAGIAQEIDMIGKATHMTVRRKIDPPPKTIETGAIAKVQPILESVETLEIGLETGRIQIHQRV